MAIGIKVSSLDKDETGHPEWFESITWEDLHKAWPDVQRRVALGSNKILIEVVDE